MGPGNFGNFVSVPHHVMGKRSVNWLIIIVVPLIGMAFDLFGKVFSNMYYPTQTQIHIEIEAKERAEAKKNSRRPQGNGASAGVETDNDGVFEKQSALP